MARPAGWSDAPLSLWFRSSALAAAESPPDASPFLPALLLWCMAGGEPLTIDADVSQRLLDAGDEVAEVCTSFWPATMHRVAVRASGRRWGPGRPETACFFSRGVDSWNSILTAQDDQHEGPVSRLVHLPGRDLPPGHDADLLRRCVAAAKAAAGDGGLELVTLETNLLEALPRRIDWNTMHGAVLAGAGLALGPSRMLIPSSVVGDEPFPWGSHPRLDPLFSTESTEVVHHANATRLEKVKRVARSSVALRWLRVCYRRTEGNCGRCEKCLRTMVELHVADALEKCPAFARPLDLAAVATTSVRTGGRRHWREARAALDDSRFDRELAGAIELALVKSDLKQARERVTALGEPSRGGPALPPGADVREVRRALRAAIRSLDDLAAAAYPPTGRPAASGPPTPRK